MNDNVQDFIAILKDLVSDSGLTLRQLEKESGVSAMQYSRYLRGSIPTIDITLKIAKYFDCSLDYLFGLDSSKKNNKYITYEYDISGFIGRYEKLLSENNITHFKFAQNNVFNESIIRHWKSGRKPRLDIIYLIASTFDSSIDYLIGRK